MKKATLCLLLKNDEILLAMKKRGFGVGKWNGVGGKVEEGESIKSAAIRELSEEIGVVAAEDNLEEVGDIKFYFTDKPEWAQHMHVFVVRNWEEEPTESEEMRPQWFDVKEIPYAHMWPDDPFWLPLFLQGKKFKGKFVFEGDIITEHSIYGH